MRSAAASHFLTSWIGSAGDMVGDAREAQQEVGPILADVCRQACAGCRVAAPYGQYNAAPCTPLHNPRGPSRKGPACCKREPSLVQQPPASHAVTIGGRSSFFGNGSPGLADSESGGMGEELDRRDGDWGLCKALRWRRRIGAAAETHARNAAPRRLQPDTGGVPLAPLLDRPA